MMGRLFTLPRFCKLRLCCGLVSAEHTATGTLRHWATKTRILKTPLSGERKRARADLLLSFHQIVRSSRLPDITSQLCSLIHDVRRRGHQCALPVSAERPHIATRKWLCNEQNLDVDPVTRSHCTCEGQRHINVLLYLKCTYNKLRGL
jgi:hypothetical protein